MRLNCLIVAGGPLDEGIYDALYFSACRLINTGEKYLRFKDENGEGGVSTKHKRCVISSNVMGILFEASVDYNNRSIKCRFIVNDVNIPSEEEFLENGYWIPYDVSSSEKDSADWWKN